MSHPPVRPPIRPPIRPLALDDLDIAEMERRIELAPAGASSWCASKCAVDCGNVCTELVICSPNVSSP